MKKHIVLLLMVIGLAGYTQSYQQSKYASNLKDVVLNPQERPASPRNGSMIINKSTGVAEYYFNGTWYDMQAGGYGGDAPTGLESITEDGQTGWRLIGADPANYGDIGDDAIDISISDESTNENGSVGAWTFTAGYNNLNNAVNGYLIGTEGEINNGSELSNIYGGTNNIISNSNTASIIGSNWSKIYNSSGSHILGSGSCQIDSSAVTYNNIIASTSSHMSDGAANSTMIGCNQLTVTGSNTVAIGIRSESSAIPDTISQDFTTAVYRLTLIPSNAFSETDRLKGTMYYEQGTNKIKFWDGTEWKTLAVE